MAANMFTTLQDAQRAGFTVLVFFAVFFLTLSIGRFLKRRAGVRLGVMFQLFCLTLAFYTALWAYGVSIAFQQHVGAAVVLMSTVVVVALVNRYLWDYYFEKKRQTPIPDFLREMVALVIFLIALLLVLSVGYHAENELKGLLAGSGIAAIILGFAGQNIFSSIIAGVSIQISRPYKVGDWLKISDQYAEVMEINWRSTRLRTNDAIYLDIPNNEIVRQTIVNLHYPTQIHAMRIRVGVEYHNPPNRVKDALYRAATKAQHVLPDPPPKIFLVDFAESAVIYEIKFYMGNHAMINEVNDAIRTNVWYELRRERITIPFPVRTLRIERQTKSPRAETTEEARAILRGEPLFNCLADEQLDGLLKEAAIYRFGRGERLIEEGAEGNSMFILLRGTANVSVARNGAAVRVGVLRAGDCFGEMSLLTGEPRTATVQAELDCVVLEISKPVMAELLRTAPECLGQLSELLAQRKLETEGILRDATPTEEHATKEREYRATFLSRLRTFFEL
jgi:small-conductance mechanosensitive channel/CRP-like cAMP-binding protein